MVTCAEIVNCASMFKRMWIKPACKNMAVINLEYLVIVLLGATGGYLPEPLVWNTSLEPSKATHFFDGAQNIWWVCCVIETYNAKYSVYGPPTKRTLYMASELTTTDPAQTSCTEESGRQG